MCVLCHYVKSSLWKADQSNAGDPRAVSFSPGPGGPCLHALDVFPCYNTPDSNCPLNIKLCSSLKTTHSFESGVHACVCVIVCECDSFPHLGLKCLYVSECTVAAGGNGDRSKRETQEPVSLGLGWWVGQAQTFTQETTVWILFEAKRQ